MLLWRSSSELSKRLVFRVVDLTLAQIKLLSIPIIDCLLIIFTDTAQSGKFG